jgi:hypothetical protein
VLASFSVYLPRETSEVNTVAFLPTAGIFGNSQGLCLLENKWSPCRFQKLAAQRFIEGLKVFF